MNLNSAFIQNITNLYSNQGSAWLNNLPTIIKTLQSRWNLSNLTPVGNMTFNYVATATSNTNQAVVLKIGYDRKSIADEMRALRYFNGNGAISLIEYNEEHNALLLQQAIPGVTLKSLYPSQVDTVIDRYVEAMQALHSKPLTTDDNYPHISDWLMALDKAAPHKFPPQVLTKAIQIKNTLLKTANTQLFLHGDLHLDNILQNGNLWVAIDPKGVIGDPEFEIFAFDFIQSTELANPSNINSLLDSRSELIARKSNLNAQRIKEWAFVRLALSAAWSIEDNCDPSWAINLATMLATQSG